MLIAIAALATLTAAQEAPRTFIATSVDGYALNGQVDPPVAAPTGVVILVAGTGAFDRDVRFGRSGTPRDLLFADLGRRFADRGLAAVRFDRRGVRYGVSPTEALDREAYPSITAESLSADVGAIDTWVRSPEGLGAQCVVYLVHPEGTAHLAGRAEAGMTAPDLIIGVGAPLESKVATVRWQLTGRDADSLQMMDADGDGVTTNEEVRANWMRTPSAVFGLLDPYLHPTGQWSAEAVQAVRTAQASIYEAERERSLAMADDAPYPSAEAPSFSYAWWKSWFTDDTPLAERFARWDTPLILHYGDLDSQVRHERQRAAAEGVLASDRVTFQVHPGRGHSLGEGILMAPMDEVIADQIAAEAASACQS